MVLAACKIMTDGCADSSPYIDLQLNLQLTP
jgi:hypothetical protein